VSRDGVGAFVIAEKMQIDVYVFVFVYNLEVIGYSGNKYDTEQAH